jgi:hypothetical protein
MKRDISKIDFLLQSLIILWDSVKKDKSPFTQLGRKQLKGYHRRFFVRFWYIPYLPKRDPRSSWQGSSQLRSQYHNQQRGHRGQVEYRNPRWGHLRCMFGRLTDQLRWQLQRVVLREQLSFEQRSFMGHQCSW